MTQSIRRKKQTWQEETDMLREAFKHYVMRIPVKAAPKYEQAKMLAEKHGGLCIGRDN